MPKNASRRRESRWWGWITVGLLALVIAGCGGGGGGGGGGANLQPDGSNWDSMAWNTGTWQ